MTRMTMVAVEDNGGLPWTLVASHQFDFVLGDDFPVQFGPGREAAGASVDGEDARVVLVHLAVEHVGDGAVDALVVVDGHQEGHQSVGRRVLRHLVHLFLLPIVLVQDRDLIDVRVGPAKVGSAVPGRDAQLHLLLPIMLALRRDQPADHVDVEPLLLVARHGVDDVGLDARVLVAGNDAGHVRADGHQFA